VPAKEIERVQHVLTTQRDSFALRNVISTTPSGRSVRRHRPVRARRGEFRRVESLPAMRRQLRAGSEPSMVRSAATARRAVARRGPSSG